MSKTAHLHLFEGFGIEMEYMIVDRQTLKVLPIADFALTEGAGECVNELERGDMAWSNELVSHVIELKTNGPAPEIAGLAAKFQGEVTALNALLAKKGACLMPTAMHPFFDPEKETQLWEHDDKAVYEAYNRIFGCKGHGWSNLQSVHINLPFHDDAEFGKLHAAIRLVLPILPALAASSPMHEGRVSGLMDSRLEFYRHNQRAVPSITGGVIPEQAFSRQEYEDKIFKKIYRDIAPHDPEGDLQFEWLNSRGAIARFDRNAIEIRVLDIQESPLMDAAVIASVVSAVKALVDERWCKLPAQKLWPEEPLRNIFLECLKFGSDAKIANQEYLQVFGHQGKAPVKAQDLWRQIVGDLTAAGGYPLTHYKKEAAALVEAGCLAGRIVKALGPNPTKDAVLKVYTRLCKTLADGGAFDAAV